jgi:L-ascorbate metabolism protein UlaG (beta-lactamase superfamily)
VRVTYVGHATLLLELGGVRVLTDPNFEPKLARLLPRVAAPGIPLHEVPKLDAILLTHAHADHLSFDTLDALPRDVPLYAPPAVQRWLQKRGYGHAVPIAPDEEMRIGPVTLLAAAARHRGNRYGFDRWRAATNMYLLDDGRRSCFFAGDTALVGDTHHLVERHLHETGRQLDVALLPIGHAPWWKPGFRRGHLTSEDALELFQLLKARLLIPYHWGTFQHLTSGAFDAVDRLRRQLVHYPQRESVKLIEPGEVFEMEEHSEMRGYPPKTDGRG